MPPGTGDAQLTLSQSVALDGAIIVTTPQDVALLDAVKGVHMFQKVNVPILGIIENMSYFICGHCGHRTDIFDSGGARKACDRLHVSLLGEIPLDTEIRAGGRITSYNVCYTKLLRYDIISFHSMVDFKFSAISMKALD